MLTPPLSVGNAVKWSSTRQTTIPSGQLASPAQPHQKAAQPVFFGWDPDELSPEREADIRVLIQAIESAQPVGGNRVLLNGRTYYFSYSDRENWSLKTEETVSTRVEVRRKFLTGEPVYETRDVPVIEIDSQVSMARGGSMDFWLTYANQRDRQRNFCVSSHALWGSSDFKTQLQTAVEGLNQRRLQKPQEQSPPRGSLPL